MSVRATTTHIDKYGVTHRIDLVKSGYVGSSTELRGSDGFLRFAHENLSEADVFSTPVQRGRLDYGVWIDSSAQKAVIDELFVSQEGEFLIQWYISGSLFWTGTVALDLSNFDEGAFPYRAQITAKDLTYLEGLAFPTYADPTPSNSFATRRTLISLIAECLPYSLNIVTATSWVESNIDTDNDFLRQVYLDASVLQGLTKFEALSRILSDNGCFLKQTDGVWLIEQLSAHATPGSVKRWTYNSSGVYQSEATVDPRTTANTDLQVVTGSLSSVAPAYKSVQVQYNARTPEPIDIPKRVRINPGDPVEFNTFTQQYISTYEPTITQGPTVIDVSERVRFISTVTVQSISSSASGASKRFFDVKVRIRAGNRYAVFGTYFRGSIWNVQWSTTPQDLVFRANYETDSFDPETGVALYKAQINVESGPITAPTNTDFYGRLSVELQSGRDVNGNQYTTTYDNNTFELVVPETDNVFRLTQANQYSTAYEKTATMGDGPRAYALSSLRYATGSLSLDKNTEEWQRRGSTDWRSHSVNLAKEVMDFQRSYARTLQVQSRGAYTPSDTLVYDGVNWYYIGGGFDGFTGDWIMTFVRNSFATATDTLATSAVLTPTTIGPGIVSAIASTTSNTIEAVGQFLLRLALPASGTVTQLVVTDIDQFVRIKEGQVLRLVHPVTLQSDEVTVSSDRTSGAFVNVTSKTLTADYPTGSYVFVSAQSLQAGILVAEDAVRIFAEGQAIGRLTSAVNGTVTSLAVNLYTKVLRGMEMQVVGTATGQSYAVTVNQDEAGPGEVTLAIEEQVIYASAGDSILGDNSFQQSQITVTQGLIVLKVNSNGKVAQIKLGADDLGSEIDISAEQVKINGIVFTEGTDPSTDPGDVATSNYVAGTTGWKIDGDGSAEFNNVTVRGVLQVASIDGDLTLNTGVIRNSSGNMQVTAQGVRLNPGTTVNPTGGASVFFETLSQIGYLTAVNNLADTELDVILRGGFTLTLGTENYTAAVRITESGGGRVDIGLRALFSEQIDSTNTTDSTTTGTGAIITAGGAGIAKNLYVGANLRVLGTTEATSTTTGSTVLSGGLGVAKNLHVGGTGNFTGALRSPLMNMTAITDVDSPYTVLATDTHIAVDNNANPVTINLPTGTNGRRIVIFDSVGGAGSGTITINRASTDTINGGTSTTLTTNYQSVTLIFNAGNWTII